MRVMKTSDAIEHFKGATNLARALGIKPSSIADWRDVVPDLRQLQIESITSGALQAEARLKLPALQQTAQAAE